MIETYKSICYCTNLRRSANFVSGFYDSILNKSGLTISQYYLLINLSRLGAANITHWANHVGLDRSTMVRNIKPLQNRNLIEIAEGHGKTFTLSQGGKDALNLAIPLWQNAQKEMETILGKENTAAILRISSILRDYGAENE